MAVAFQARFKLATAVVGGLLISFSIATIIAEAVATRPAPISAGEARPSEPESHPGLVQFAIAAAPLRGDLLADLALARDASKQDQGNGTEAASRSDYDIERLISTSLSFSPHASAMWLLLARLGSSAEIKSEALKMSYLTSPATPEIAATRLKLFCQAEPPADADLMDFVRSDIRLATVSRPDLKHVVAGLYAGCSSNRKQALYEIVRSLDPSFAASLN